MIILGVTGSIGMGKSTVSKMLRDMGIPVHDADAAVHGLLAAGGAGVVPVGAAFPEALRTDAAGRAYIDRAALGAVVFADPSQKQVLEGILHPLVRDDSDAFCRRMKEAGHAVAALDIPLLFETGGEKRVDKILCVSASAAVQKQRVLARPGMTEERFNAVLAQQMPDAEKRKRADFVVTSDTSLDDTRAQLKKIVDTLVPPDAARRAAPPANGR